MDPAYLFQKGAILQLAGTWCPSAPCIIAAFGNLKPLRHLCDPIFGTVVFHVKITGHFRFFAKKSLAFFKNSFSSSRSLIRFLGRAVRHLPDGGCHCRQRVLWDVA